MVPGFLRSRLHEHETGTQGGAGSSPKPTTLTPQDTTLLGFQNLVERQGGDAGRGGAQRCAVCCGTTIGAYRCEGYRHDW